VGALFAHTCGVVPATKARMSVFSSIKTSLQADHKDNMADGLSTYMVADRAGERMRDYALESTQDKKTLLLYGEPYRGTPDAESARKIMDFARTIAPNEHFVIALETHIFAPTTLATELPTVFDNGHMTIEETADGSFVRTFKLESGPALWWFADHAKRARFVDWITVLRKQEEAAQAAYIEELFAEYKRLQAEEEAMQKKRAQKSVGKIKKLFNKVQSYVKAKVAVA
jgi:DNA mismatch repair ATPase MutS